MKIAFVFPGQGSQYPGMGEDFYNKFEESKKIFDKSGEILGFSIADKCFKGTKEELMQTDITQPAILTHSLAVFEVLKNKIPFQAVAGHSLGEYSALYAGGALSLESVLNLVKKRGEAMAKVKGGGLAALIGRDFSKVNELCEASGWHISIFNSPKQIILAGKDEDFEKLAEIAPDYGIKKVKKLTVSGPFHSILMKSAADEFSESANKVNIDDIKTDIYMNTTAVKEKDSETIKSNMVKQIYTTVKWKEEVENMIEDGIDTFIELGPKKVLSGIISSINKDVKIFNIDKTEDIETVMNELELEGNNA